MLVCTPKALMMYPRVERDRLIMRNSLVLALLLLAPLKPPPPLSPVPPPKDSVLLPMDTLLLL